MVNTTMIDGVEYHKVMKVTNKADYLGFIILPPAFKKSLIEPSKQGLDTFKVKISEMRYPTVSNVIVHEGTFNSVEVFVDGAYLLYESLTELGVICESEILTAAQHFILMDRIKKSGK
jgi:hypothetical protein